MTIAPQSAYVIRTGTVEEDGLFIDCLYEMWDEMGSGKKVYILSDLPEIETHADVVRVDLGKLPQKVTKEFVGLSVLSAYLQAEGPFPLAALNDAIRLHRDSKLVEKQLHSCYGIGLKVPTKGRWAITC